MKEAENTTPIEEILFEIFNGQQPTIREFIRFEKKNPNRKMEAYYFHYYRIGFTQWSTLPASTGDFIMALIRHNWPMFLLYLIEHTMLGRLRYTLVLPKLILRLTRLVEIWQEEVEKETTIKVDSEEKKRVPDRNASRLAFCFQLAFVTGDKNSHHATREVFYQFPLLTDEVVDFLGYMITFYMQEREKEKMKKKKC